MAISAASVVGHTTASVPRPHILYLVQVKTTDGETTTVSKRYSEVRTTSSASRSSRALTSLQFVKLHDTLNDPGSLPPKRLLATTFIPSAWLDDTLISERKAGLSAYLHGLIQSPQFRAHQSVIDFLSSSLSTASSRAFSLEDALPSTLSRKTALNLQAQLDGDVSIEATPIAAAYYPDWSAGSNPPNQIDFSKFDILFFGTSVLSPCAIVLVALQCLSGVAAQHLNDYERIYAVI